MVAPFFALASACIPYAGERSRHLQFIRSTNSGTSPTAGHAWVHAPPFEVIDITLRLQPYRGNEAEYLPGVVLSSDAATDLGSVDDIISQEVRLALAVNGVPERDWFRATANPKLPAYIRHFPARVIKLGDTQLKYVPVAGGASVEGFEEITNIQFSGRYGRDVYQHIIEPRLTELRRTQH